MGRYWIEAGACWGTSVGSPLWPPSSLTIRASKSSATPMTAQCASGLTATPTTQPPPNAVMNTPSTVSTSGSPLVATTFSTSAGFDETHQPDGNLIITDPG